VVGGRKALVNDKMDGVRGRQTRKVQGINSTRGGGNHKERTRGGDSLQGEGAQKRGLP